jgi:hypothetical protein
MRILQYYKQFENNSSDDYQLLVDTLQGELFDGENIYFLDDDGEENHLMSDSKSAYWTYGYNMDGSIRQITICHLSKKQVNYFMSDLMKNILPIFIGRTDMKFKCEYFTEEGINYIMIYLTHLKIMWN